MIKKILVALFATLSLFSSVQPAASAATYYQYGVYDDVLKDRVIRAYVNEEDAKQHNGWCYVPGNSAHRKTSWSCTVKKTKNAPDPLIMAPRSGEWMQFGGKWHRAELKQPSAGYLPYCYPSYYENPGGVRPAYYCAYWV
ncbi:hypothetical protein [Lentzea flaviverrucosa]|uniref:Peptidase inhibitor family I36 n=1 Tax=Lentzea flaviverrucosa TaxID=200379 RepID=A0A1H9XTL0_9PSEU|nr:hypothetical protein [Lentzea flaviverrucosa]RDI19319.1 hypothetical protein DFR72_117161 [Lentzea flaviverrucosa]SES49057.1 hypothetical protein SAMN05216195_11756 [Lentzea flaviverrucosa]